MTDPLGHATTYVYNATDRITSVTLPKPSAGSTLDFTSTYSYDNYDAATGLVSTNVTDPNGNVTKQQYDQFGRLAAHFAVRHYPDVKRSAAFRPRHRNCRIIAPTTEPVDHSR